MSDHAKRVALELLARERTRPNFGNGGAVENLLSQAKSRYMARIRKGSISPTSATTVVFAPEDFDPDFERHLHAAQRLKDLFKDVVGCEEVIRKLEEYQMICRNMKERNEDPSTVIPTTFLFKGPPGNDLVDTCIFWLISLKEPARPRLLERLVISIMTWAF